MNKNAKCKVINRSAGRVYYNIPELNIRKSFAPQEEKIVTIGELEALSYQPGGKELMLNFLQVTDINAVETLTGQKTEPEYLLTTAGVRNLLENGSIDQLLDAFDFGPEGVKDLIKTVAFDIKLSDLNKAKIIKEKTGFDIITAIQNETAVEEEQKQILQEKSSIKKSEAPSIRRATPITQETTTSNSTTQRRTTPNYKVVNN